MPNNNNSRQTDCWLYLVKVSISIVLISPASAPAQAANLRQYWTEYLLCPPNENSQGKHFFSLLFNHWFVLKVFEILVTLQATSPFHFKLCRQLSLSIWFYFDTRNIEFISEVYKIFELRSTEGKIYVESVEPKQSVNMDVFLFKQTSHQRDWVKSMARRKINKVNMYTFR